MDEGFEFHWYPGQPPYSIAPDGKKHRCKMRGRVPVIGGEGSTALAAASMYEKWFALPSAVRRLATSLMRTQLEAL